MGSEIVILDDELNFAKMLAEFLQNEGYSSAVFTHPTEVLEVLQHRPIDLIISDYKMSEMDGEEFVQKAHEIDPQLPIIIISGVMHMPDLIRVANLGVALVLEKPFDAQILLEHVGRFVGRKGRSPRAVSEGKQRRFHYRKLNTPQRPPSRYVADASLLSRQFFSHLWKQFLQTNVHFIAMPPGSEFDNLLHEMAAWKQAEDKIIRKFKLTEFNDARTLEYLRKSIGQEKYAPILGIYSVDLPFTEQLLRILGIAPFLADETDWESLIFVFQISGGASPQDPPADKDMPDYFAGKWHWLPPLRERPLDLALYVRGFLQHFYPGAEIPLDATAIRWIFQYDWPGNYHELGNTLWSVCKNKPPRLERQHFEAELLGRIAPVPCQVPDSGLSSILQTRQKEYLARLQYLHGGEIPVSLLPLSAQASGLPFPDNAPLFFPELLEPIS